MPGWVLRATSPAHGDHVPTTSEADMMQVRIATR